MWFLLYFPVGLVVALLLVWFLIAYKHGEYPPTLPSDSHIVVISGCDTGFGRLTSIELATQGFHVVSGVLMESSAEELEKQAKNLKGKITTVLCDITKPEDVEKLKVKIKQLSEQGNKVVGLVNNAGIAVPGPLEYISPEKLYQQMDVNTLGHHAVTVALLPFIRNSKGRIVNITSIAGKITGPLLGPYSMSKFAMEAFTDTLRNELFNLGVSVSAIEPGFAKTEIVRKASSHTLVQELWNSFPPESKIVYKHLYDKHSQRAGKAWEAAMDPVIVVNDIIHALTSTRPKTRYLPGIQAKIINFFVRYIPHDRMRDILLRKV